MTGDIKTIKTDLSDERRALLRKGLFLQGMTVVWNLAEGSVAVFAGLAAGSIALLAFGFDSFVETVSGAIVGWRLWSEHEQDPTADIAPIERRASKTAGILLIVLAVYVLIDSVKKLLGFGEHAHESLLGLALTVVALIVMPLLARAKLKVADQLGSKALRTDAMETVCCAWLAGTTLLGLILNATLHWWWADSVAGLIIVPLLIREGLEGIRGEECGCHKSCEK